MTRTRCLHEIIKELPDHTELRDEDVLTSTLLLSWIHSTSGNILDKTPYEVFNAKKPDLFFK